MNLISANSRLFTQAELRLSTLMRECTAVINTLTEYEFLILGSKHPTVLVPFCQIGTAQPSGGTEKDD